MERFFSLSAELKSVLLSVNRQVWNIDPIFVIYSWLNEAVNHVSRAVPFLFFVVGIGYVMETTEPSWTVVLIGIGAYATYLTISSFVGSWEQERRRLFESLLNNELQLSHVKHLATLDLGRLVDPAFIKLTQLAQGRGKTSIESLWQGQKEVVGAVIAIAISAVALLAYDWPMGVIALSIALPSILHRWFSEKKRRELHEAETIVHRQRTEVYEAIASPKMAVLTRLLKQVGSFFARYSELSDILKENVRIMARFERWWEFFVGIISILSMMVFAFYFAFGLVNGHYTLAGIGIIFGSLRMVSSAIHEFGWSVGRIGQRYQDYQYLKNFFQTGPLVDRSKAKPIELTQTPALELVNAKFAYPGQTKLVINDVSLVIEPGEKVALIGPNGCGKTTLLRLQSGVYAVSGGDLLVDEHSLALVSQESWLNHVVMITQSATLPGMEIIRAITGEVLWPDYDRLQKALEFSGADAILNDLPLGLSTWIGEEWVGGKGFSTGERQRLVLAAAFYRFLCPEVFIALFDEPTANCDSETKAKFYGAINEAPEFKDKTVIVSLHDPLYLDFFDRVLQFENGRLVNDLRGQDEIQAYRESISFALATDL